MAQFNSTTFGPISGRHGSAVAAITKSGKNILKVYKAPSNPNTEKQQAQRAKFGYVKSELNSKRKLLKATYGCYNGIDLGVSYALKNAVVGEFPDYSIDYSLMVLSNGGLDATEMVSGSKTVDSTVKIEWDTMLASESHPNDGVNLVFMNAGSKIAVLKENASVRSAGSVEVELPAVWVGAEIHCWIYFTTPNGTLRSTSRYISLLQL